MSKINRSVRVVVLSEVSLPNNMEHHKCSPLLSKCLPKSENILPDVGLVIKRHALLGVRRQLHVEFIPGEEKINSLFGECTALDMQNKTHKILIEGC